MIICDTNLCFNIIIIDAYIAGGYDGEKIFGDIWRLCLVSKRWSKLSVVLPEPVYFHSADVTPVIHPPL